MDQKIEYIYEINTLKRVFKINDKPMPEIIEENRDDLIHDIKVSEFLLESVKSISLNTNKIGNGFSFKKILGESKSGEQVEVFKIYKIENPTKYFTIIRSKDKIGLSHASITMEEALESKIPINKKGLINKRVLYEIYNVLNNFTEETIYNKLQEKYIKLMSYSDSFLIKNKLKNKYNRLVEDINNALSYIENKV